MGKFQGKGMSFREKKMKNNERTTGKVHYLRPIKYTDSTMKNNNEEYVGNRSRDWIFFIVSLIATLAILFVAPEWVWVGFPFVFTALAGAMGRM